MTDTTGRTDTTAPTALLHSTERVSVVYTDASGDQENPGRFAELRGRGIAAGLEDRVAPHADVETIEEVLSRPGGSEAAGRVDGARRLAHDDGRLRAESYAAEGVDPEAEAAALASVRTPAAVLRWATGPDTSA